MRDDQTRVARAAEVELGMPSADAEGSALTPTRRRSGRAGPLAWAAMALVLVAALWIGTTDDGGPPTPAERVYALTQLVKCPQCAGQSVAESDVPVSREVRRDIARRVEAGQTDEAILAFYAESYGEDAILAPSASGITGMVWALPVVVVVAAGAGLVVAFRRWGADEAPPVSDEDRALVARALEQDAS